MKKLLTILLCSVLALSLIGVADAAGEQTITGEEYKAANNQPVSKYVTVSLNIDESFTVTIPADFHLNPSTSGDSYRHYTTVSAYITRIDANNYLTVTIYSGTANATGWYLSGTGGLQLLYGIKLDSDPNNHISGKTDPGLLKSESAVLSTNVIDSEVSKGMHFRLLDTLPPQSGTYTDTITFTVSMETSEQHPTLLTSGGP